MAKFVHRLFRAKRFLFVAIPALVSALALMCVVEVKLLEILFSASGLFYSFSLVLFFVALMLLIMSFVLSLLCLYLTEAAQAAGLAETALFAMFGAAYASVTRQALLQPVSHLIAGKIFVTLLLSRFWHAQFREYRMRFKEPPTARFFIEKSPRFMSCVWIVVGGWLIKTLAFSLALVENQTTVQLEGWEGFLLLATFFSLFWIFVRNPYSHSETWDDA
jgi:hypothetical protein